MELCFVKVYIPVSVVASTPVSVASEGPVASVTGVGSDNNKTCIKVIDNIKVN